MKKIWITPLIVLLLMTGCGKQQSYETMADQCIAPAAAVEYELRLQLPEEAVTPVMDTGNEKLYECDNFTVVVQKLPGGDLNRTLQAVTGRGINDLTVMQTVRNGADCYRCAWSTTDEDAQRVCRTMILDDGNAHHAVSLMAEHTLAGDLSAHWQHIMDSAALVSTD